MQELIELKIEADNYIYDFNTKLENINLEEELTKEINDKITNLSSLLGESNFAEILKSYDELQSLYTKAEPMIKEQTAKNKKEKEDNEDNSDGENDKKNTEDSKDKNKDKGNKDSDDENKNNKKNIKEVEKEKINNKA